MKQAYRLPPLQAFDEPRFSWFPTNAQCFIYRNWDCISAERMAKVLNCNAETVKKMAADMGLDQNQTVSKKWLTQGYITLIRNNWYLLDYDQLCTLLDWDKDQLAFILKEDDFLDIKLCGSPICKPDTGKLQVEKLNEQQVQRTAEIRKQTEEIRKRMPRRTVEPFDFFANTVFPTKDITVKKGKKIEKRIIYSYCALYGDTFFDRDLIDISFPEEMLAAYQSLGVTGIWTQAVLAKLTPSPFTPDASVGYEKRLEGIRYLIARLAKYGLKLYLYLNEPRTLPEEVMEQYPDLAGTRYPNGETSLCVRTEPVQKYLRDNVALLVKNTPGLGGFFTITASENHTNCHSHIKHHSTNCPRCREFESTDSFVLVNRLICEGATSVDPNIDVLAYAWEWGDLDAARTVVANLPKQVTLLNVSEGFQEKTFGEVTTRVRDYSISVEGPSHFAKELWQTATDTGHRSFAKIQVNNSWELSSTPYIPVFEKYYRHIQGILKTGNVNGLWLTWTLGGYPSPVLVLVQALCEKGENTSLREIYEEIFAGADIDALSEALHLFSEAYDNYPFHITVVYRGPQQCAVANPLYDHITGLSSTMVCYPFDDLRGWCNIFPEEIYISQLRKMTTRWGEALEKLLQIDPNTNRYLPELFETAKYCHLQFKSWLNQCDWITARKLQPPTPADRDLLEDEREIAYGALELTARNATFGYESSNHYFYTQSGLMEKIVNCNWLLGQI